MGRPKILASGVALDHFVTQCGMPAVDHGRPAPLRSEGKKKNKAPNLLQWNMLVVSTL